MKIMERNDLRNLKKDMEAQIQAGFDTTQLHIPMFYYSGDNTYIWNDEYTKEPRFKGIITKNEKEMNKVRSFEKVVTQGNYEIQIEVDEMDKKVYFYIVTSLLDEDTDEIETKYLMLNI